MSSWLFATKEASKADEEKGTLPELQVPKRNVPWPPEFQTYADFKAEIDAAIECHPPFGDWLHKYRNVNHVLSSSGCDSMFGMSIEQLKERYVKEKQIQTRTKHMKRMIAEVYLVENAQMYQDMKADIAAKKEAYQFALEKYEQARSQGYKTWPPHPPTEPEEFRRLKMLEDLLNE